MEAARKLGVGRHVFVQIQNSTARCRPKPPHRYGPGAGELMDVARQLRIHPSLLSAFLNERRELSSEFGKRISEAVDLLEEAEKVAQKARKRVLEGHGA